MDWVEPTERISDRQHAARQARQPFEMLPRAHGKAVVPDTIGRPGKAQGVVYRWCDQCAGRLEERVPGLEPRRCAMVGDRDYPAVVFRRHQHRVQRQGGWIRLRQDELPVGWRIGGYLYHGGRVAEVNADLGRRRPVPAERVEQGQGQRAAAGRVHHQIGLQRLRAS